MKKLLSLVFGFVLAVSLWSFVSCSSDSSDGSGSYIADSGTGSGGGESGSQLEDLSKYWYKESAFYHIWVKSFCDSDGDGVGDLKGIKNKLDYIYDTLGCDGIWLSPIFSCSGTGSSMHGYDTTDYYSVNSKFGSSSDLAALINACHEKGIKVIFDFVPNHTALAASWFTRSAAKQTVGGVDYTDWYVWSSTAKTVSTNMKDSKYYYNSTRGEYYYGAFEDGMPDLNYANSAVREEMLKVIKYWMDFGFDGMRVDAVRYLYDDVSAGSYMDGTKSHEVFAEWRELLDSYESPKFMMCEAWIEDSDRSVLETYLGSEDGPEFNMVLDFNQGRPCYESVFNNTDSFTVGGNFKANSSALVTGAGYASFLTNHDKYTSRIGTVFNGDSYGIAQATALSLMRPNVPIIYYGQELGMKNTSASGDAALRGDFDWTEEASQAGAAASILKLNKALLKVRSKYKALFADGNLKKLTSSDTSKLAYVISDSDTKLLCVYNLSDSGADSVSFSGSGLGTVSSYSTLIGDDDASVLSVSSGNVTVTKLAPYGYRVYLIGSGSEANLYDDETYSASHEINFRTSYDNMYLRGDMNGWGATAMTGDENMSIFTVSVALSAGSRSFKFCTTDDSSWSGKSWGSAYSGIAYPADSVFNATGSENFTVNVAASGTYTFIFDSYYGTVTVLSAGTTEDAAKANMVYIRGGFSSWNEYDGIAMAKQSDGTYAVTFTPVAGTYEFKISKDNDSWDTQWGAASSGTLTLGSGAATSGNSYSSNFKVTVAAKATTVVLDSDSGTVTVSQ